MTDSRIPYFLQLTKKELIEKEVDNVQTRCNVVNREVNKTIKALLTALSMSGELALLEECSVYVDVKEYTQHIDEWKGLTIPYKAKQVPTSFKAYRKASVNWANGRRASILAMKVFPLLLGQSVQYCNYVARRLFPSDNDRAELFLRLCEAAVISSILKSNVQLNQRSAETPLICQNSVIKHGFDKVLERYLPSESIPIIDIAASLLNETPQESELKAHFMEGVPVTTDYLVKSQKKMHQKLQSNIFAAFQKAFADLYTNRLAQYRHLYMPADSSKTDESVPSTSASSIVSQLNHWMDHIGQNLYLLPEEAIHALLTKMQQFQQMVEIQVAQRACSNNNNLQTMPLNSMGQCGNTERMNENYFNGNNMTSATSVMPFPLPMSMPMPMPIPMPMPNRYPSGYLENTTLFPPITNFEQMNGNEINTIQSQSNSNASDNMSLYTLSVYSPTISAESEVNVKSTTSRKRKKQFNHYESDGMFLMPNGKRSRTNHESNGDIFSPLVDMDSNESWVQQVVL